MATCPICERFTGSPESVEAHISGSGSGDHEGEIGKDFREQLRGVASSAVSKATDAAKTSGSSSEGTPNNSNTDGAQTDEKSAQNGGSTTTADPPKPESPEFLQNTGGVESAKLEENKESGPTLTLVATGAIALFIWSLLDNEDPPDAWEGI